MKQLPVLNIEQFNANIQSGEVYANDFEVHLEKFHSAITKPHKHDFYLVVLFTKGKGVHEIDFESYPIQPGALFLLYPGQTHHWEFEEKAAGYIFFHSKEYYEMLFPNKRLDDYPVYYSSYNLPYVQLNDSQSRTFEGRFEQLFTEFSQEEPMKNRRLGLLIDLLYVDITRLLMQLPMTEQPKKKMVKLKQLEGLIESHYIQQKKPTFYAESLHVSTKHLNHLVTESLGRSTTTLIQERIILEAKRLLVHGGYSVREVAFALGYEDPSYFTRLFRKKCGMTPSEFGAQYED